MFFLHVETSPWQALARAPSTLRRNPDNIVSAGTYSGAGGYRTWIAKALDRLNEHIDYVHTKLMIIDLGHAPSGCGAFGTGGAR